MLHMIWFCFMPKKLLKFHFCFQYFMMSKNVPTTLLRCRRQYSKTTLNLKSNLSGSSKRWLERQRNDIYVKMAVEKDVRSRAYFKLKEIQDRYRFIKPSSFVIDLGASPGGWSCCVSDIIGTSKLGKLISVDLLPIDDIPGAIIVQGDFNCSLIKVEIAETVANFRSDRMVDVVVSDMLHNTTGQRDTDHFRSMDLCREALTFSGHAVRPGGTFMCKFLSGVDEKELFEEAKMWYKTVEIVKPKASRKESAEVYLLAREKA